MARLITITLDENGKSFSDADTFRAMESYLFLYNEIHISNISSLYAIRVLLSRMPEFSRPIVNLNLYGFATVLDKDCRHDWPSFDNNHPINLVDNMLHELIGYSIKETK